MVKKNYGRSKYKYYCSVCTTGIMKKTEIDRHSRVVHKNDLFSCIKCNTEYGYKCNLNRHLKKAHNNAL